MADFSYDLECYPNFFSCYAVLDNRRSFIFEISEWHDDRKKFMDFLMGLKTFKHRMVGFNNAAYDYMLLHHFIDSLGVASYQSLYKKSQAYFADGKIHQFNPHVIYENKHHIPQVDLFKIHHFDNRAKMTSLKMIEFNMRSPTIKDLPYDPLKPLTYEQSREILAYNGHDTRETEKFRGYTQPMIDFRDKLSAKHRRNFTNFSDSKIGSEYFIMELEKHGIPKKINGELNQTFREEIKIAEVILPYVEFERPEFQEVLNFLKSSVINEFDKTGLLSLKGFFNDLHATLDGFQFDFGAGGIHGSLKKKVVRNSDTHDLLDWDVASYYPNLAIGSRFYPEHLTERFCDIYQDVYNQRKSYAKKTAENSMLKLALNSVFGNSSNLFSCFLDQKFTMSITINGQLLLCMLAEHLMKIPDLKMVQINTDGLTFLCPKEYREHANSLWKWWEEITSLELEEAEYSMMAIRDVNSYLAVTTDGYVKRIGAYAYELSIDNPQTRELAWHKNQSAVVVAKAASAALVEGKSIRKFIQNHVNYLDFMLRTKVPRSSKLELVKGENRQPLQNISRYYASVDGGKLIKTMPHTQTQIDKWDTGDHYQHEDTGEYQVVTHGKQPKSGKFKPVAFPELSEMPPREIGIDKDVFVTDCTDMKDFDVTTIDYDYYIGETKKLVDPLLLN